MRHLFQITPAELHALGVAVVALLVFFGHVMRSDSSLQQARERREV
jgi:hypothetical protein